MKFDPFEVVLALNIAILVTCLAVVARAVFRMYVTL